MAKKLQLIEVYKPHDLEPNRKPEWNTGLFVVAHKGKKHQCWSHRSAMEKAWELSTGQEIIADYTK
jgi:hypothetical protein